MIGAYMYIYRERGKFWGKQGNSYKCYPHLGNPKYWRNKYKKDLLKKKRIFKEKKHPLNALKFFFNVP